MSCRAHEETGFCTPLRCFRERDGTEGTGVDPIWHLVPGRVARPHGTVSLTSSAPEEPWHPISPSRAPASSFERPGWNLKAQRHPWVLDGGLYSGSLGTGSSAGSSSDGSGNELGGLGHERGRGTVHPDGLDAPIYRGEPDPQRIPTELMGRDSDTEDEPEEDENEAGRGGFIEGKDGRGDRGSRVGGRRAVRTTSRTAGRVTGQVQQLPTVQAQQPVKSQQQSGSTIGQGVATPVSATGLGRGGSDGAGHGVVPQAQATTAAKIVASAAKAKIAAGAIAVAATVVPSRPPVVPRGARDQRSVAESSRDARGDAGVDGGASGVGEPSSASTPEKRSTGGERRTPPAPAPAPPPSTSGACVPRESSISRRAASEGGGVGPGRVVGEGNDVDCLRGGIDRVSPRGVAAVAGTGAMDRTDRVMGGAAVSSVSGAPSGNPGASERADIAGNGKDIVAAGEVGAGGGGGGCSSTVSRAATAGAVAAAAAEEAVAVREAAAVRAAAASTPSPSRIDTPAEPQPPPPSAQALPASSLGTPLTAPRKARGRSRKLDVFSSPPLAPIGAEHGVDDILSEFSLDSSPPLPQETGRMAGSKARTGLPPSGPGHSRIIGATAMRALTSGGADRALSMGVAGMAMVGAETGAGSSGGARGRKDGAVAVEPPEFHDLVKRSTRFMTSGEFAGRSWGVGRPCSGDWRRKSLGVLTG